MGALKPARLDDDPLDGEESPKGCTRAKWSGPAVFITFIVLLGLLTTLVPPPDRTVVDMARDVDVALDPTIWETAVHWTGSAQGAREVLEVLDRYHAWILVTKGPNKPTRRADGQPFLTVGADVALPTTTINVAATVLEGALGRRLFGMHMEAVDMTSCLPLMTGSLRPYVIWEVGSGLVLVDKDLAQRVWGETKVQHMIGSMSSYLFSAVADSVRNTVRGVGGPPEGTAAAGASEPPQLAGVLGPALAMAVAAAFAAAPPLWFCIVCPAVLGLLAPLVVNIALNQLAGYLCTHMALPDDQCFDLLLGALGLGFVLSLASAIPIFYVCQLQECAHRDVGSGIPPARRCAGVSRVWGSLQTLLGRKGGVTH